MLLLVPLLLAAATPVRELPVSGIQGTPARMVHAFDQLWLLAELGPHHPDEPVLWVLTSQGKLTLSRSQKELGLEMPTDLAAGPREVYVLSWSGQLAVLDEKAQVRSRHILRGSHPYPRYPYALAYDGTHELLWVAGCFPTHNFLDLGCLELHAFRRKGLEYVWSGLETPPLPTDPRQRPANWNELVRVGPKGELWVFTMASPGGEGWVRVPGQASFKPVNWGSYLVGFPRFHEDPAQLLELVKNGFLVVGMLFPREGGVWVAAYQGIKDRTIFTFFDEQGEARAQVDVGGRFLGNWGEHAVLWRQRQHRATISLVRIGR